jgi:general secretion pathway protein G
MQRCPDPHRRLAAGFSLIEFTAVLALMAILATFVTINVRHVMAKAKQKAAVTQISSIRDAVEKFFEENKRYPTNDEGLTVLTKAAKGSEPLMKQIPLDPWDHPYQYLTPGHGEPYEVICYGADGREGGDGADADISSATLNTGPGH